MSSKIIRVFLSCSDSREDEELRRKLEAHLAPLLRDGRITELWHSHQILPGSDAVAEVETRLGSADVILLLVSPDFIASPRCWEHEMGLALQRHHAGKAQVIPVILRPCVWRNLPFGELEPLPQHGSPVSSSPNPDDALLGVVEGICAVLEVLPKYPDERTRELSEALKDAYRRRGELDTRQEDTTQVNEEILQLRRALREGGQLKAGDVLADRYRLLEELGKGGFAKVWTALDLETSEVVAVKVLHGQYAEDRSRRERFFRGAKNMAKLRHPNIVGVVEEKCEDGGFFFFVMEYIRGGDLQRAVLRDEISTEKGMEIILSVGDALQIAHKKSIIHRDIKPSNILLDEGLSPKLCDFDLVRAADTTGGTRTGMLGTAVYAAQELLDRPQDADKRVDVFALGMTGLFVAHRAILPWDAYLDTAAFIGKLQVGDAVKTVLSRAVARRKEDRFDSIAAFCNELRDALKQPSASRLQKNRRKKSQPELDLVPKYQFRRSLIIGLGGTGRHVCTQVKRLLLENSDNDPARFSHVRLLSIDTGTRVQKVLNGAGDVVQLDRQETLDLRIPPSFDTKLLHRIMNDHVRGFLPHANEHGAMRSRPIGHAFLVINWFLIREHVKSLIYANLRTQVPTDPRFKGLDFDSSAFDVYVVGNLVAGTGSGMALGMGYLLRDLTHELELDGRRIFRTEGIFTVCGAYALADHDSKPNPYAANCYAALLELNHFANQHIHRNPNATYDPGLDDIRISTEAQLMPPYDSVQLLSPSHSAAGDLSHNELEPHIAEVLALRIGSAVGMTSNAKAIEEMACREGNDSKGNPRFCWAWGAHTIRSFSLDTLDLATTLAVDMILDVLIGEHVHGDMNRKEVARRILRRLGFGYSADVQTHTSLLTSLLTPQEELENVSSSVSIVRTIEEIVSHAFPELPKDENLIEELVSVIDRRKAEISGRIRSLISTVIEFNRRSFGFVVREAFQKEIYRAADFSVEGRGSLDDAIGIIDLLVALLRKESKAYQKAAQAALNESRRGRQRAEINERAIRTLSAKGHMVGFQALSGPWKGFVQEMIAANVSKAREAALREAHTILEGDAYDKTGALRPGLLEYLEGMQRDLLLSKRQMKRLAMRSEAKIERFRLLLHQLGGEQSRLFKIAHQIKNEALQGDSLLIYAAKVVRWIGAPYLMQSRYDDPEMIDRDYAVIDGLMREHIRRVGTEELQGSIENNPSFDSRLPSFLELSEPAIRVTRNSDSPAEIVYVSVPPEVPSFIGEMKYCLRITDRPIKNKSVDSLFQERSNDNEPRVDILACRLSFSPASVIGIERWAKHYSRAGVSKKSRGSLHTLLDFVAKNLSFKDLESCQAVDISAIELDRREQIINNLTTYLISSGRYDRLGRLLMDFNFIKEKIARLGVRELISDYDTLFNMTKSELRPADLSHFISYKDCHAWIRATLKSLESELHKNPSRLSVLLLQHQPLDSAPEIDKILEQAKLERGLFDESTVKQETHPSG